MVWRVISTKLCLSQPEKAGSQVTVEFVSEKSGCSPKSSVEGYPFGWIFNSFLKLKQVESSGPV
jgi:hypothetical protein